MGDPIVVHMLALVSCATFPTAVVRCARRGFASPRLVHRHRIVERADQANEELPWPTRTPSVSIAVASSKTSEGGWVDGWMRTYSAA